MQTKKKNLGKPFECECEYDFIILSLNAAPAKENNSGAKVALVKQSH